VVTDLMLDLVGAALACNLTRIVTFQLGYCGNQWSYRFLGFTEDCHAIAHRDTVDGANVSAGEVMTAVSRWTSEKVARLVNGLEAVPEGDGTALDNSLVVWSNENASGVHTLGPLPVVMVGRAGGRLKQGGLIDAGEQPHQRLGTSVLRLMGVDAAGFGDQPECGPIEGLT
jgi:hypothetical protein